MAWKVERRKRQKNRLVNPKKNNLFEVLLATKMHSLISLNPVLKYLLILRWNAKDQEHFLWSFRYFPPETEPLA